MLTSTWNISILPAYLFRAQTLWKISVRVGLNENANSFFAAFGVLKIDVSPVMTLHKVSQFVSLCLVFPCPYLVFLF